MKKRYALACLLLGMSGVASAQYVIGDTQYTCPAGASWNDPACVRQPINADAGANQPLPPRPIGKWKTTWGAIADDVTGTGNIGVAVDKRTKREAESDAISNCESLGGGGCKLTLAYENQCAVIASPASEGKEVGGTPQTQGAESIAIATSLALPKCSKRNNGLKCIIVYSACSKPVFEKF